MIKAESAYTIKCMIVPFQDSIGNRFSLITFVNIHANITKTNEIIVGPTGDLAFITIFCGDIAPDAISTQS